MILVITLIAFITAVALYFINDSRIANEQWENWQGNCEGTGMIASELMDENQELKTELQKWKRPRARNGRFK
jgi:hypothetical protein